MKKIIFCFIFLFTIFNSQNLLATTLKDSVNLSERSEKNVLRDKFRNPLETLKFFEIEPSMTIIELSPGNGWYTEILSTYLYNQGKLIAAEYDPNLSYFAKRSR